MLEVAAGAILRGMALALGRAIAGPTVYDRIVSVSMFGTHRVLMIAVLGFLTVIWALFRYDGPSDARAHLGDRGHGALRRHPAGCLSRVLLPLSDRYPKK